ncbi:MAG TPA: substrate-binding domain-containing protein [Burkholderiales bacterium]|jgi:molybdate transport system substrate-binding protein
MTGQASNTGRSTLRLFSSTALKSVMTELAPLFQEAAGVALEVEYGTSNQLIARIAAGEEADIALLTDAGIQEMIAAGRLATGSRQDFAQTGVGVGVRTGTPRPDISDVEAFTRALLQAPSVTFTASGASGVYFAKVLERLGIAEQVRAKAKIPAGGLIGELLVRGETQLGVQLICELLAVPGVDLVGPLPAELQSIMVFSAGTFAGSAQALPAQRFHDFLRSTQTREIMRQKGLQTL